MSHYFIDLTGRVFDRLTVIARAPNHLITGKWMWNCRCSCGKQKAVLGESLRNGRTRSCGCLTLGIRRLSARTELPEHLVYSQFRREYESWRHARARCADLNDSDYGGRGIRMAECWTRSFCQFYTDMGVRPPGYTLERLDVNGDYTPENCIWLPKPQQALNKRNTVRVSLNGLQVPVVIAAKQLGISPQTIYSRIKRGFPEQLWLMAVSR